MRISLSLIMSVVALAGCGSGEGLRGGASDAAIGTGGQGGGPGGSGSEGGKVPDTSAAQGGSIGLDGPTGLGGIPSPDARFYAGAADMGGIGGGAAGKTGSGGNVGGRSSGGPGQPGYMVSTRTQHVAILLPNGKVLLIGGWSTKSVEIAPFAPLASAEIFDPATGTFAATGSMATGRLGHTATLLANGKVLVAGTTDSASAELFDPSTGTFTVTGNMTVARKQHTATLLENGKVLIAGGYVGTTGGLASAELFDPATGTFTATGNLAEARYMHAATLVQSKKVLLLGGFVLPTGGDGNHDGLTSAELYDPASGTFTATGSMKKERSFPIATLLSDGRVLVSGGPNGFEGYFATDVLELYDPATGKFTSTGRLVEPRTLHTATLLPTGMVLFAGGYQRGGMWASYLASSEVYDPSTGTCAAGASMAEQRENHTATALPDGSVLIAGGDGQGAQIRSSVEIYR